MTVSLSRRQFLKASAAVGGGLALEFSFPVTSAAAAGAPPSGAGRTGSRSARLRNAQDIALTTNGTLFAGMAEELRAAVSALRRPNTVHLRVGRCTDVGMLRDLGDQFKIDLPELTRPFPSSRKETAFPQPSLEAMDHL